MDLLNARKLILRIVCAFMVLATGSGLIGQPSEYSLKSVFLYNFSRFIEWPDSAFSSREEPFTIGILGRDPFGPLLEEAIAGETYHGRPIQIARYRTVREIQRCQLLFISAPEIARTAELSAAIAGKRIVTVGETDRFVSDGGMIALVTSQNRVRVRLNPEALRSANINVSSKLLRIAEKT